MAFPTRGPLVHLLRAVMLVMAAWSTGPAADPVDELLPSLGIETVQNRAAEIAASEALDESTKAELADTYARIIANLETVTSYQNATDAFRAAIDTAPAQTAELRSRLEAVSAPGDQPPVLPEERTLAVFESELLRAKAELAGQEAALSELKARIATEEGRPALVRQRLSELKSQIVAAETDRAPVAAEGVPAEIAEARAWAAATGQRLLEAEVLLREQELASQPMRLDRLRAQLDLAEYELRGTAERVRALEQAANEMRQAEATRAKIEAEAVERLVASEHPVVAELAARNTRLSEEIRELAGAIEGVERDRQAIAGDAARLEQTFATTREKIEVAGVSQILGQVLQEQRRTLPSPSAYQRDARQRESAVAEATLSQILLEEERAALRDLPGYVAALADPVPAVERDDVVDRLTELARTRQALVDRALDIQRRYLQATAELDFAQNRLADVVERFDAFLDKRLLWVRSTRVAGLDTVRLIPGQVADLLDPAGWNDLAAVTGALLSTSPLLWLALLAAMLLLAARRRLRRVLVDSGQHVNVILRDRLADTLRGIGAVVLLALPWPLVLFTLGQELRDALEAGAFAKQVGHTFVILAPLLMQLRALRLFVAPRSIAAVHFGWQEAGLKRLHRDLAWFAPVLLVAAALTVLSLSTVGESWGSGLGRAFFLVVMAVFAVFFARLSHPRTGTLQLLFRHNPGSLVVRLRYLWVVLMVGVPVGAMIIALAGFMYTAGTLVEHILDTAWFALLVLIVHQLIVRWLVINQRRLRLQALRARRQAELEARAAKETFDEGEGGTVFDVEEPRVDFKALDATSRKLTSNATLLAGLAGLWLIWRDMLPALRIFDDVTLWTYTKAGVDGEIPITLTSLGIAVLVLFVMIVAVRQLPAFLEITLLQRLHMSQGSRYTVLTLTKYTIVAVSVAWIFGTLGGSWSEIQWIFAALGVGIGFGLQEIVANFISGLIILFERPIRVGDVVTVGNTDGVVTRIQIRATTIRNWDRKELLVPNKNFITQELLNWSLSDNTTRILINVGIAYGSDAEKALRILEEVAKAHPRVMHDPAPFVVFDAFGDNALMLSLRCYIDDIDFRLRTITELNLAIDRQMNAAGIVIAFPQRDVHLDVSGPLKVEMRRPARDG